METILLIAALVSFGTLSCNHTSTISTTTVVSASPEPVAPVQATPTPEPTTTPSPAPFPSPSPELSVVVTVDQAVNFSGAEMTILEEALVDMNQVLNSACFKSGLLAAPLVETQNMTNLEIYDYYMDHTTGSDVTEGSIVLNVTLYYSWWAGFWDGTYGYTFLGDPMTYINTYFYGDHEVLASTLAHEHSHTLGFTHNGGPKDTNSVPYSLNRIFDACYKQLNP